MFRHMFRRTFLQTSAASAALLMFRKQLSFAKTDAAVAIKEPLLAPFGGPYGGVPPFNKIKESLNMLEKKKIIGFICNDIDDSSTMSGYYNYYRYNN